MKEWLQKQLDKRKAKIKALQERSNASESIDEVRSIGVEIDEVNDEIRDLTAQLDSLERNPAPAVGNGEERGFNPLASYGMAGNGIRNTGDIEDIEYRTAFMDYVLHETPIPDELRTNANTLTTDVAGAIPTVLVNKIIERMDDCGTILSLVTKTAYAAGIAIPTSSVKPVATWVLEGKGSDKQKKTVGTIKFTYFKLRCEISISMEVGTIALSAFEAKFIENVSKAMVIAIEKAILTGSGITQPKGILKETPTKAVVIEKKIPTYQELLNIEGVVPTEFETTAKWFMTKASFLNFVGMVDSAGQPIARTNFGITGKPERYLLGREVIIHPYATEMGNTLGFIVDISDYVLNTIYDMGISKKQDWDTEDMLTKAVMSADGKLVDTGSLITVTAKAA